MATAPTAEQMAALLTQWNDWLSARTDTMLSLEDRARTAGTDKDRDDLAAAFVARKVVGDRLEEITALSAHDRAQAGSVGQRTVARHLGRCGRGQNMADAAALIDAIVDRVETHVTAVERQSATDVETATRADADLTVAERLAKELGSDVQPRRTAAIGSVDRAVICRGSPPGLPRCAASSRRSMPNAGRCSRRGPRCPTGSIRSPMPKRRCDSWPNAAATRSPTLRRWPSRRWRRLVNCQRPTSCGRCRGLRRARRCRRSSSRSSDWRPRWPRPVVVSNSRSTIATIFAACCSRSATRPTPTGWARTASSNRCTAKPSRLLWAAPCDLAAARPLVDRYVDCGQRQDRVRSVTQVARLMKCAQPGCTGTIVDGYCDVCGLAPPQPARPPTRCRSRCTPTHRAPSPAGRARPASARCNSARRVPAVPAGRLGG